MLRSRASDGALYERIRLICCDSWGLPPWEFDAAAEAGRISYRTVFELLMMRASQPFLGEALVRWLLREDQAARTERLERMRGLVMQYQGAIGRGDAEAMERLEREMGELNRVR